MQPVAPPPFTEVRSLRGLSPSPHGRSAVLWSVRASLEANAYLSELLHIDLESRAVRPLTQLMGLPTQAQFTDHAVVTYAAGASVWDLRVGDAPTLRVDLPWSIAALSYAPGSKWLLASYNPKPVGRDPFITQSLPFKRDGLGRMSGPASTVAVDRSGEWHALTPAGIWGCEISPDRKEIAYLTRPAGAMEFWDAGVEVCSWDDERGQLTGSPRAIAVPRAPMALRWGPEGQLAVLAFPEVIGAPTAAELWVGRPSEGMRLWGEGADLCLGIGEAGDVALGAQRPTLQWFADGSLLVLERNGASIAPMTLAADGSRAWRYDRTVVDEACVCPVTGQVLGVCETPSHLQEVAELASDSCTPLTNLNPWTFPMPERFTVPGAQGDAVDVFALWADSPEQPAPTVLVIHGGPHGAFGDTVYYQHHMLARSGINVVWANPHGSMGYGSAFARALVGHWGELDSLDWAEVVAELSRRGRAPEPLAVWGSSYGGFMATWLAGHWPQVRAAVIQAPVADQWSMYAASDIGYAFTAYGCGLDFGGGSSSQDEVDRVHNLLWRNSPLRTYQSIEAAVLLLHGSDDDRCPLHQSEELYTLLKYAGKDDVQLVIYPGESHLMTTSGLPRMRADRYRRIREWLREHVMDTPTGT